MKTRLFTISLVVLAVSRATVLAQELHENAKLTASDANQGDFFGRSVSISGDTIVVGALETDCVAGQDCGAAYVYEFDGFDWIERAKLTASDAASQDRFGTTVSIDVDTIVVGANGHICGGGGVVCVSAYVFVKPGGGWTNMTQTAKLGPSDLPVPFGNAFGESVSISGDTIVVGARTDDCAGGPDCGSAYVFVKPSGGWSNMTQTAKLTASDAASQDRFGTAVSINGDTIVVGCLNTLGLGYVFVEPVGGWADTTQTAKLTISKEDTASANSVAVSINQDTVVVGQPSQQCGAEGRCGAAYVFVKPGVQWSDMTQTAKLTASDMAVDDSFGSSVSISGDTIVVAVPGADCDTGTNCGSAYLFLSSPW